VAKLISFDIDGTLETGDPPGIITMARVREAQALGYIIGSCSDRTVATQQRMWQAQGINVDFTVLKHRLDSVKAAFSAEAYFHIGDTHADQYYAEQAGFTYFFQAESVAGLWRFGNMGHIGHQLQNP
jgi:phosphoglycolate phosphatase-like HAD superfamily hydrolase